MKRTLQATTVGVLLALTMPAFAEPSSAPKEDHAGAEAKRREAEKLLRVRDVARACMKLGESVDLWPKLTTRLALARCHVAEKRYALASDELEAVAAQGDKDGNRPIAKAARADATFARARTGRLVFTVAPEVQSIDGLDVRVASTSVPASDLQTPKRMDVGTVKVEAVAPNRKPWSSELAIVAGKDTSVVVPPLEQEERTNAQPLPLLSTIVPQRAVDRAAEPLPTTPLNEAPPTFSVGVDSIAVLYHDPAGYDGRMLLWMLRAGWFVQPTTEVFVRTGVMTSSLPGAAGAFVATNLTLGVIKNFPLSKQLAVSGSFATMAPIGSGGGDSFDPAARATNQTAVQLFGPMFEPNFLTVAPGAGVQWNAAPFRLRVRSELFYLIRTRGDAIEHDAVQLRLVSRARPSVQFGPMQLFAEAMYGRFLIEPWFIPKVPDAIDSWIGTAGVSANLRPFVIEAGYSRAFDLPMRRNDYNIANLLVALVF